MVVDLCWHSALGSHRFSTQESIDIIVHVDIGRRVPVPPGDAMDHLG